MSLIYYINNNRKYYTNDNNFFFVIFILYLILHSTIKIDCISQIAWSKQNVIAISTLVKTIDDNRKV